MSLPIVVSSKQEKWDCHQCGFCCRGSLIPLKSDDLQRLSNQNWEQHPEYRNVRILVRHFGTGGDYRLAHRADGTCVFLTGEGRCHIHERFGSQAKPTVCQIFPLQLVPQDRESVLTIRRACPSAAADLGRPLAEHAALVKQFIGEHRLSSDPIAPPPLKHGDSRDWKTIRRVLQCAEQILTDQRYPPVRRVVHALQFVNLIGRAQTKRLTDQKLFELAQTLVEVVPDESEIFFENRRPPRAYSQTLFRTAAINVARLHPLCEHRRNWSSRFQLFQTGWRILRGSGQMPNLGHVFPQASFKDLESARGALQPEVYVPLTRYLEANATTFLYSSADRQRWPLLESVRGLAILFPIGLWMLRWLSFGRQPTHQDMLNIIVALDRSQGFAPLNGSIHRWRLAALSTQSELERLSIWYSS